MRRIISLAVVAFCLVLFLSVSSYAFQYQLTVLQTPEGHNSYTCGINENGQIVGVAYTSTTLYACYWDKDGNIHDLKSPFGNNMARGINNQGLVVGPSYTASGTPAPVIWDTNNSNSISILTSPVIGIPESFAVARDINESSVIAGWYGTKYGGSYACYWDAAGVVHTIGSVGAHAYAINSSNQIALDNGTIWDPITGITNIGSLGGRYCHPFNINDYGQVVGYSRTESYQIHAFIWDKTNGMRDLGAFGAYGVNNLGQVVGSGNQDKDAVVWQSGSTIAQTLSHHGYVSAYAVDINDFGQIVGAVSDINGQRYAAMWQPVPEPSAIFTLLCGITGLAWKRRKH